MRSGRASAHVLHKVEKRLKRRLFIDREALVRQVCAGSIRKENLRQRDRKPEHKNKNIRTSNPTSLKLCIRCRRSC
jgi:hypothetical protein